MNIYFRYKDNVVEASKILTDRLVSGVDLAVWWTEYVIRHKGTRHIKCPAVDVPFYKFFCLDVLLFLAALSALLCYLIYYFFVRPILECVGIRSSKKRSV